MGVAQGKLAFEGRRPSVALPCIFHQSETSCLERFSERRPMHGARLRREGRQEILGAVDCSHTTRNDAGADLWYPNGICPPVLTWLRAGLALTTQRTVQHRPMIRSPARAAGAWTRDRHPQGRWCSVRTACRKRVRWLEETPERVLTQLALRCAFWAQAALAAEA
jgi:hypothetical protein